MILPQQLRVEAITIGMSFRTFHIEPYPMHEFDVCGSFCVIGDNIIMGSGFHAMVNHVNMQFLTIPTKYK